jgi:hypothetical protein
MRDGRGAGLRATSGGGGSTPARATGAAGNDLNQADGVAGFTR